MTRGTWIVLVTGVLVLTAGGAAYALLHTHTPQTPAHVTAFNAPLHTASTTSSFAPARTATSSAPSAATTTPATHAAAAPAAGAPNTHTSEAVVVPTTPQPSQAQLAQTSAALRSALVNIVCYAPASSHLHSISGSGVIIDPKGVILTNAHVAQYFLLQNKGVSCTVRTGSPARAAYDAQVMYFPKAWATANAGILYQQDPTGTGAHDYALLAITGSADNRALPALFPTMPLASSSPRIGTPVVVASYGAQFLTTAQIQTALFPTVVYGSVKKVFTFATDTVDVLSLGGSAAAQEGSSGGGIANGFGRLAAMITTSTVTGPTASRTLNGITLAYIKRDFQAHEGMTLNAFLQNDPATTASVFATQAPNIEKTLLSTSSSTPAS